MTALYDEVALRQVAFSDTGDPNDNSSLNTSPIGTLYKQIGIDPVVFWTKNRVGSNGWNITFAALFGRNVYVDFYYTGENGESDGSILRPFTDPQAAINAAEDFVEDINYFANVVFISPSDWTVSYDLVIHKSRINLVSTVFCVLAGTITYTNATPESLALYRAGGSTDYSLLVNQGNAGPDENTISGFNVFFDIELLGVVGDDTPTTTNFFQYGLTISNCVCDFSHSLYARNAMFIFYSNFTAPGFSTTLFNCTSLELSNTNSFNITYTYDSTDLFGTPSYGPEYLYSIMSSISGITLRKEARALLSNNSSVRSITCYDATNIQAKSISIHGNVSFNNNSYFTMENSRVYGNLTVAAGNTGVSALTATSISGTITDTSGCITYNDKWMFSPLGGRCVLLRNLSGATLTKGAVVRQDTSNNDAILKSAVDEFGPYGVVLSGILNNKWGWVVTEGPGEILVDNTGATSRGDWIGTSASTQGQATSQASPPTDNNHFRELGHAMAARSGAGLVKCMIHLL